LNAGDIFSEQQAQSSWELDGGKRGVKVPGEKFFAGARLMIDARSPFDIKVTDFTAQTSADGNLDTWVKWLGTEPFSAPARVPQQSVIVPDLIPVSTCYETVWPENE
jgi:hypothetical protein